MIQTCQRPGCGGWLLVDLDANDLYCALCARRTPLPPTQKQREILAYVESVRISPKRPGRPRMDKGVQRRDSDADRLVAVHQGSTN